jgi:hypothetical protein
MDGNRVALYERLPEIYRLRDVELDPPGQLEAYLALVEDVYGAIHENIESLYHDLFVETADDWVVPYIGDLLGTSHLAGDPWTIRADVADTVALRRRKGTLGAIELLTFDLTKWGVHCLELLERLVWLQHLNHQRPDAGGSPPYGLSTVTRHTVIRGGTATVRDPVTLSLLGTPFDPFARVADARPPTGAGVRFNLPNLAIFLWRLAAYRVGVSAPFSAGNQTIAGAAAPDAARSCRFSAEPLGRPLWLFNTARYDPERQPPMLTALDETPGPMPRARLTTGAPAGNPDSYVAVETYDPANLATLDIGDVGLQLHLPRTTFPLDIWTFRGANLCAWEDGLEPPLRDREIAIDPVTGRFVVGVMTTAEANAVRNGLLVTFTYGAVGPVGAHPISRMPAPDTWEGDAVDLRVVDFHQNPNGLTQALNGIQNAPRPIVVEIQDSMVHDLDVAAVGGTINEAGGPNLRLNRSLVIRAAAGERPIVRLARPLRFRPTKVVGATPAEQDALDAAISRLFVRIEGVQLTRGAGYPAGAPLIARASVHALELVDATLDPGGFRRLDGTRTPLWPSLELVFPYGFANANDEQAFKQTPAVAVRRSVTGSLLLDTEYTLSISSSIVDAGRGVADEPDAVFAVSAASDPVGGWGPPMSVDCATFFGRTRARTIDGRGGIWVHALEAQNDQKGCIRLSYFSGVGDRLPQNEDCVQGTDVKLRFVSEDYGDPAYAQLARSSDRSIRERGLGDDEMGAFNFLLEAHKWRNLEIRYREFMPVGVRPVLIPVT